MYKDPAAPVAARVEHLLSLMTLEEKVAQMLCLWQTKPKIQTPEGEFDPVRASESCPHGMGMLARPSDRQLGGAAQVAGNSGTIVNRTASETARYVNAAQKWAMEQTRLGIPMLMHEEACHGYVARGATSFPQAIGLASSFDPELVEAVFSVAASEMRAAGTQLALAPVVDVARDPRWGRIEETFGEDPHLSTEIGKAAVLGLQGPRLPLANGKVLATLKHMTGHGQPESGTNIGPAQVSERVLREAFFPPFKRIIEETGVGAIMPSYNEIDGQPSHASVWLLRDILRKEWGYQGLTVSDYFGNRELITRHRLAADNREAAIRALLAGVDVETPDPETYKELPALVREGKVPEALIDEAVRRVLSFKFEAGLFENPYVDEAAAEALTATPASIALARRAATRSAVLLKNDGVLPLEAKKIKRLLVLGTHAADTPIGGYSDIPKHVVSVLEGLQAEGKQAGFEVEYAVGVGITKERIWGQDAVNFIDPEVNRQHIREAVERAKHADHIVMVLGDNEQTSREAWADAHLGDRDSLELMGEQNELAAAIFALKKPTVVFLLNGRPLSINFLASEAGAIIEGWYLGQETGHAAADLLFGRANPGGKLPVSIPRSVGQLPVFYNHKPSARRGYLAGSVKPLYPFGYGLSYTQFEISEPVLAKTSIGVNDSVAVDVTVKNVGSRAGDEVVQLYVRDDVASVTRPVKELKHFKRIHLQPGESQQVRFTLKPADLAFYNVAMKWVVEPGTFTIYAGPDSEQLKSTVLTVQG